jgi:hypothetical protein
LTRTIWVGCTAIGIDGESQNKKAPLEGEAYSRDLQGTGGRGARFPFAQDGRFAAALHVSPEWQRVRAHVFLCMLACCVEWHMRDALKLMPSNDEYIDL